MVPVPRLAGAATLAATASKRCLPVNWCELCVMLFPMRKTLAVSASSAAMANCLRTRAAAEGGFHGATLGHMLAVVALVVAAGCGKPASLALALLCLGRSTESRMTFLEVLPSSFSSNARGCWLRG